MPLDIVFLGPPGAGKGTQAKRLAADTRIAHIATGDMIRAMKEEESELGLRLKGIYDRGELVPDDFMVELIRERLARDDAAGGFILDGFPRTVAQAEALDQMLEELGRSLAVVFEFQLPDDTAIERVVGRARAEGRSDDAPEVVRRRFEIFRAQTEPVVTYYLTRGILVGIHADRTVDEVFAELQDALEQVAVR